MIPNNRYAPPALQQPDPQFAIRPVTLSDVGSLETCLWHNQNIDAINDFVLRVLKFEEQQRGIGIVVVDDSLSSASIIAYGQITQWIKCAEISDLIVHPDYRGQGIGTAMIQHLTHYGLKRKVNCVELGVTMTNQRALALYRRLGFQDSYTLQLDLGEGVEPVLYLAIDLTPHL
jgi:ribosomal protein S18 acetylase RimI-like enzyme